MEAGQMNCLAVHCESGMNVWLLALSRQSIGPEFEQRRRGRVHCALTTSGNRSTMRSTGEKGKPRRVLSLCGALPHPLLLQVQGYSGPYPSSVLPLPLHPTTPSCFTESYSGKLWCKLPSRLSPPSLTSSGTKLDCKPCRSKTSTKPNTTEQLYSKQKGTSTVMQAQENYENFKAKACGQASWLYPHSKGIPAHPPTPQDPLPDVTACPCTKLTA